MNVAAFIGMLMLSALGREEKFSWAPVTDKDWKITADSANGIRDAVMMFEKITADDRKMGDEKVFFTFYHRIRILSADGRKKFGDITLPYLKEHQKIRWLYARTLLRDGQEFTVGPSQVFEKDVLKAEGIHVREKSFSLPGMTDDCIVEYAVSYEQPVSNVVWYIQKDIPLLSGEYRWYPAPRTSSLARWQLFGYEGLVLPNYLWLRDGRRGRVNVTKLEENSDLATFTIDSVAAYESEEDALTAGAVTTQLRLYYTSVKSPVDYWSSLSGLTLTILEEFGKPGEKAESFVAGLDPGDSAKGRVRALYDWLQRNITNTDYLESDEREAGDYAVNGSVDELLEHRYGSGFEINMAFFDLLKRMGVSSYPVYAVSRDDGLVVQDAKYWQFDGCIIAVPWQLSHPVYYSPGNLFLPPEVLPRFYEGTPAYFIEGSMSRFKNLPFSPSSFSRSQCVFAGAMGDDLRLRGRLSADFTGHEGRSLRLRVHRRKDTEREQFLKDEFTERFSGAELDSVRATVKDSGRCDISLAASLSAPATTSTAGSRVLLQPLGLLAGDETHFTAPGRKAAILFDYAHEDRDILQLQLPAGYTVESLPRDTAVANRVGACEVKFSAFGQTLTVQCLFKLNAPMWGADAYPDIQRLFRSRDSFRKLAVVLKH